MGFCNQCGTQVDLAKFCNQCGTPVMQTEVIQARQTPLQTPSVQLWKGNINWKKIAPLLAVLVVAGGFYLMGKASSDPEKIAEKFQRSLETNDEKTLLSLLAVPKQIEPQAVLTEENAGKLLKAIKMSGKTERFVNQLKEEAIQYKENPDTDLDNDDQVLSLVKNGKTWLFFDQFKVQYAPSFGKISTTPNVRLSTVEKGVQIKEEPSGSSVNRKTYEIGPLLPGEHTVQAKLNSSLGEFTHEEKFEVSLGEEPQVDIRLQMKQVSVTSNFKDVRIYYKEKPLALAFKQSWGTYEAVLRDIPAVPLEFTIKADTPFGEIVENQTLEDFDTYLSFKGKLSNAPNIRTTLGKFFVDYNQAWVKYASTKTSTEILKPFIAPGSTQLQKFEREISDSSKRLFVGQLTGVAIDYSSVKLEKDSELTVSVKETYDDKWKDPLTGQITGNGKQDVYWIYKLKLVNGEWKILENYQPFFWFPQTGTFEDVSMEGKQTEIQSTAKLPDGKGKLRIDATFLKTAASGKLQGVPFGMDSQIKDIHQTWGKPKKVEYYEGSNAHFYPGVMFRENELDSNNLAGIIAYPDQQSLKLADVKKLFGSPSEEGVNDLTQTYDLYYQAGQYEVSFSFPSQFEALKSVSIHTRD